MGDVKDAIEISQARTHFTSSRFSSNFKNSLFIPSHHPLYQKREPVLATAGRHIWTGKVPGALSCNHSCSGILSHMALGYPSDFTPQRMYANL